MRVARRRDATEEGAVLILALVFLVAIAVILTFLVTLTGTNLLVTSKLQAQRNVEYAADALVDGAIQAVRHQAPNSVTNPTCPSYPSGSPTTVIITGQALVVECSMVIPTNGSGQVIFYGRIVEFDACVGAAPAVSFSSCQNAAIVRASVVFNDVSNAPGCKGSDPACYPGFWGTGMNIESWVVETANH
jgi:hypothetical protein